jgi:hypothetical protein
MRTVLAIALCARLAHAQYVVSPPPPSAEPKVGWNAELGLMGGELHIDGAAPAAGGLSFAGGLHVGAVALFGEVDGLELGPQRAMAALPGSNAAALDGQLLRLGGTVRVCSGCTTRSSMRYWAEGGVAHEWVDDAAIMTCGGPCDSPTGPAGWDHAFLLVAGVNLSR